MKKSKNPCKPDCPNRNALCHVDCLEYKLFKAEKELERCRINALKKEESLLRSEAIRRNKRRKL